MVGNFLLRSNAAYNRMTRIAREEAGGPIPRYTSRYIGSSESSPVIAGSYSSVAKQLGLSEKAGPRCSERYRAYAINIRTLHEVVYESIGQTATGF